jgi:hypothetical protein
VRERWPDGTVRNVSSWCRRCGADACREYRQRNPEAERRRRDPEYDALRRMQQRDYMRRKRAIPPERRRAVMTGPASKSPVLDAAPFAAWLKATGYDSGELQRLTGVDGSRFRYIIRGEQKRVSLDLVDRIMLAMGAQIDDVYGEVAA